VVEKSHGKISIYISLDGWIILKRIKKKCDKNLFPGSGGRPVSYLYRLQNFQRKHSWSNLRYYSGICLVGLRKTMKNIIQ
jgi:hypothetical protein